MDIKEIMNILPHRYPFLLIDKVTQLEENKVTAIKNVTANITITESNSIKVNAFLLFLTLTTLLYVDTSLL